MSMICKVHIHFLFVSNFFKEYGNTSYFEDLVIHMFWMYKLE